MADKQAQIPGGAYLIDKEEATLYQRQVPGGAFVIETQQSSAGVTYPQLERFGHRGAFRGMLH